MHSKIRHIKTAYKTVIIHKKTKCPICKENLELEAVDEEKICKCGYVYYTPNNYVSGVKINTDLPFKTKTMRTKKK